MRKTVLITGGTSGIGKALVELYGSNGYNVVFTGRDPQKLKRLTDQLDANSIDHLALVQDASSASGAKEVVSQAVDKFGGIDVLICNAGVSMKAFFEDVDLRVFEDVLRINLMGTVNYVKYALPHIIKSKGSIVGISSINGHRGTPGRTAYSASKFAMEGFFESLRIEVCKRGVHVMTLSPGYTKTEIRNRALSATGDIVGESFRNESKMMTPEEVAMAVYKGQQRRKRTIILTLLGKALIFLNKRFPKWMDRTVYNVMYKEDPKLFKD